MTPAIPTPFPTSLLEAARVYRGQGWIVHPLHGPNEGAEKERGKKPKLSGYTRPEYRGLDTERGLEAAFANGARCNLGLVIKPPRLVVDLDSKADKGESVRAWLASRPELAHVPRERTAGGAHLHFICKDAPELKGGKDVVQLNKSVSAELFTGPSNVVAAPSVHPSGVRYTWEQGGEVPEVSWKFIKDTFKPSANGEAKGRGDWNTLDIVGMAKELGIYGWRMTGEKAKHAIKCPWHESHTDKQDGPGTDTAIFEADAERMPGFKCQHGHCETKRLKHFLAWAHEQSAGIVDRYCSKAWEGNQGGGDFDTELIELHGDPFTFTPEGRIAGFGEAYWAALYAKQNIIVWEPEERKFYQYDESTGLYVWRTQDSIKRGLSDMLLHEGRTRGKNLARWRTDNFLNHLTAQLRGIAERRGVFSERPAAVHLANGVIDFSGGGAALVEFSPRFYSRNAAPISFKPEADCPRFLNDLVLAAVHPEDVSLLQRFAGLSLLGRNRVQRILILDGLAGRGKSTLSSILQGVVGLANCTQLRTERLTERFETNRYIGKTLLIGVDVDPDFLRARGASVLKGLVGGDNLDTEAKGVADTCKIKGDFLVIITANSRLRVRLQRDIEAWKRRLCIVRYEGPPPAKKIPDLAGHLIRTEGAGILNWALAGLAQANNEIEEHGDLVLTPRQLGIVDCLLEESESLKVFLQDCIERDEAGDLAVTELMEAYFDYCPSRGWEPLPSPAAQAQLPTLMLELFRVSRRHDIKRGTNVRGFKGVRLKEEANR
jgi:putative DNA primase/helicase